MIRLPWLLPQHPYTPVAAAGLLSLAGDEARIWWEDDAGACLSTSQSVEVLEGRMWDSELWPSLARIPWQGRPGQSLRAYLLRHDDPYMEYRRLIDESPAVEARWLQTIATDTGVYRETDGRLRPLRSRMIAGLKSDLGGISQPVKRDPDEHLTDQYPVWNGARATGRRWQSTLGLAPEATPWQPEQSGAYSPMLYRLLWHGLMALGCTAWRRPDSRHPYAGPPLLLDPDTMGWVCPREPVELSGLVHYCTHGWRQGDGWEFRPAASSPASRSRASTLAAAASVRAAASACAWATSSCR